MAAQGVYRDRVAEFICGRHVGDRPGNVRVKILQLPQLQELPDSVQFLAGFFGVIYDEPVILDLFEQVMVNMFAQAQ